MRFYTQTHKFYCGIDLHASTMYLCIVNHEGEIMLHKDLPTEPEEFLKRIEPYREDVVVGVECVFLWYWLADLCADETTHICPGTSRFDWRSSPSQKITEALKSIGKFCPSPDPGTNWMCASGAEPAF